jgi:hypothetical protein
MDTANLTGDPHKRGSAYKDYGETALVSWPKFVPRYSSASVSTGNTFQDLPRLRETADNTERYI